MTVCMGWELVYVCEGSRCDIHDRMIDWGQRFRPMLECSTWVGIYGAICHAPTAQHAVVLKHDIFL